MYLSISLTIYFLSNLFIYLSVPKLAKVPRLPRNLYSTFESAAPATPFTLRKCCACHAIQTWRNLRVAVPMGPRSEHGPNALRTRSERGPNALRPGAANRLAFGSPETPIHARGPAFCSFLYSPGRNANPSNRPSNENP